VPLGGPTLRGGALCAFDPDSLDRARHQTAGLFFLTFGFPNLTHVPPPSPQPHSQPNSPSSPQPDRPLTIEDARDLELVETIRGGDAGAWPELITRYQDRLFAVCLRLVHDRELASDLTQDTFVKVIQNLDKYDGRSKLSTWLIRITMNVCLSKLRSEKLRRHASLDAPSSPTNRGGGNGMGPGEAPSRGSQIAQDRELSGLPGVERDQERQVLLAALRLVDDEQRAILILRDGHGLEYEQIAETTGIAVGTVKSRLFRARLALREAVEQLQGKASR
jgi:RNA polymerase sigma-70 factor, ECF subfamily